MFGVLYRYECRREADGSFSANRSTARVYKRVRPNEIRIPNLMRRRVDQVRFNGRRYRLYQLTDGRFGAEVGYMIVRVARVDFMTEREENPMYFI